MPKPPVHISINGQPFQVASGTTVLAALFEAGISAQRRSVTGEPRAGICGMGICFECRVAIDQVEHQRACMVLVREGMEVRTDG